MAIDWVPEKGLEPSRLSAQEPKSCVSASSTTPAGVTSVRDDARATPPDCGSCQPGP